MRSDECGGGRAVVDTQVSGPALPQVPRQTPSITKSGLEDGQYKCSLDPSAGIGGNWAMEWILLPPQSELLYLPYLT